MVTKENTTKGAPQALILGWEDGMIFPSWSAGVDLRLYFRSVARSLGRARVIPFNIPRTDLRSPDSQSRTHSTTGRK